MPRKARVRTGPVYLSTQQVAEKLGVSLPTVIHWVDDGRLRGHRTPGGHRRIAREDLVRFAREFDYPLPPELVGRGTGPWRVVVADPEVDFAEMLREFLVTKKAFHVWVADGPYALGWLVGRYRPDLVLLCVDMPGLDAIQVRRALCDDPETAGTAVMACATVRDAVLEQRLRAAAFDAVLHKPVELDALYDDMRDLLEKRGSGSA